MKNANQNLEPVGGRRQYQKPKTELLPLTPQALEYLTKRRGLREDALKSYRISCNKAGEICIPFFDERNELVLVKRRAADGGKLVRRVKNDDGSFSEDSRKTDCEAGGKPILLGTHLCDPREGALVICFGDYDAISISQDGVPNAVSLPFGDKGFGFVETQWSFLQQFKEFVIYPDADDLEDNPDAALLAANKLDELARRLGKASCRLVRAADRFGTKDANELLLKKGAGANLLAVQNAEWFPVEGLVAVADYIEPETIDGTPTRLTDIDAATGGLTGGQLIVVSGDNGAGKSTFVLNLVAAYVALRMGVFFWSGEQKVGKVRYWFERIIAGAENLESHTSERTGFVSFFPTRLARTMMRDWYRDCFYQYTPVGVEAEEFFAAAEIGVRRHDCRLLVIDNLMSFTGGEGEGYYQAQGDFAESCKRFAEKWNVAVILVCHNKKEDEKQSVKSKSLKMPDKNSVEGSKKITNWADFVFQLYRIPYDRQDGFFAGVDTMLRLCKNRESGILEDVRMVFELSSNRLVQFSERFRLESRYGWERNPAEWNTVEEF